MQTKVCTLLSQRTHYIYFYFVPVKPIFKFDDTFDITTLVKVPIIGRTNLHIVHEKTTLARMAITIHNVRIFGHYLTRNTPTLNFIDKQIIYVASSQVPMGLSG